MLTYYKKKHTLNNLKVKYIFLSFFKTLKN